MRNLYGRLAAANMKNNRQFYLPYILTGIVSVIMFYTMVGLFQNKSILGISGGNFLYMFLELGSWVIGIFVTIFLFYTNSFIMKRRKKELGIYNILGMEKKHIAKIMALETVVVGGIILVGGILFGVLFNKLFTMLLLRIVQFEITIQFTVSMEAIGASVVLFGGIFLCTLIYNLFQVLKANPMELLKGGNVGEKEPKTKVVMTVLGLILVGIGYYISLTTESPLAAIMLFFVAVICVIIGTYMLFTAGSIAFLKLLRRNKNFYYKTSHFTSISGMLYRMKQNAVGLANICILSTMVLVILSTTISMFVGVEDELETRFPADVMIYAKTETINEDECEKLLEEAEKAVYSQGRNITESSGYLSLSVVLFREGNTYYGSEKMEEMENGVDYSQLHTLDFMTKRGIEKAIGVEAPLLAEDEVAIYGSPFYEEDTLSVFGKEYKVVKSEEHVLEEFSNMLLGGSYYVVLPNETALDAVYKAQKENYGENASDYLYHGRVNMDGTSQEKVACYGVIVEALSHFSGEEVDDTGALISVGGVGGNKYYSEVYSESRDANRAEFFVIYGSLFFLGIFLGVMFLMVTGLIIYFKQISEGYDDRERFITMQKVGMSKKEVKASIASQVRLVFLLPILVAAVHMAFAYPIVVKLLALLNLSNETLFAGCLAGTILVFVGIYYFIFKCTSGAYYRIVGKNNS